jgi:hypothetical protein
MTSAHEIDWQDAPTQVYEPYDILEVRKLTPDEENTRVMRFDGKLGPDEKLVVGYLTLEQERMFDSMSVAEQERVAAELRR